MDEILSTGLIVGIGIISYWFALEIYTRLFGLLYPVSKDYADTIAFSLALALYPIVVFLGYYLLVGLFVLCLQSLRVTAG